MTLLTAFPPASGVAVEVLATDLSTRILERASAGIYPIEKAKDIPEPRRKAFMLRGTGSSEGLMSVGPELRAVVTFARQNLVGPEWPGIGTFDLVFCRNVLIYFAHETKRAVVRHLLAHLVEDGALFLGHAESLSGLGLPVHAVAPTVVVHEGGPLDHRASRHGGTR
jgi:chemotaxis protein methyltransferase CheR